MIWLLPAIGAVGGALMNKKNPLKGAAMGGLLGAAGGAGLGAMGGAMGSGAAIGGQQAVGLAAQEAGLGAALTGWGGATTGLQGAANAIGGGGLLNTAGDAMKTAGTVRSMMPPEQPLPQAPLFSSGGGQVQIQSPYQKQSTQHRQSRYNRFG
jgi:hypothetical protein